MKNSPKLIGLFQAIGVAAYIGLFAIIAQFIQTSGIHLINNQALSIILPLLIFVISALICGSIVLLHPIRLFFADQRKEAFETVFWCIIWLILLLIIFAILCFRK